MERHQEQTRSTDGAAKKRDSLSVLDGIVTLGLASTCAFLGIIILASHIA